MRLLHTMLRVNNLDESLKFYCDQLGMMLALGHIAAPARPTPVTA